jgi:hypothetical protein
LRDESVPVQDHDPFKTALPTVDNARVSAFVLCSQIKQLVIDRIFLLILVQIEAARQNISPIDTTGYEVGINAPEISVVPNVIENPPLHDARKFRFVVKGILCIPSELTSLLQRRHIVANKSIDNSLSSVPCITDIEVGVADSFISNAPEYC